MDVDIIVPAFGARHQRLAKLRALPSAVLQTLPPRDIITCTGKTVVDARNSGAELATAEWLCFLDADDELEPRYLEAMATGTADLRGPATKFLKAGGVIEGPLLVPARDLETENNYLVIGTLVRRAMFEQIGGFRNWPVHEDYDLWLRCVRAGATVEQIEEAVYIVHESTGTRNRKSLTFKRRIDAQIRASVGL